MSVAQRMVFGGLLACAAVLPSPASAAPPTKMECISASEAGQDLQQGGKLLEAREKLALCVAQSCPGPVQEDCAARLKDIAAAMPSIVFEATDGAGHDLSLVRVTADGKVLADKLDGTAIEVDPGEHRFAFEDRATGTHVERSIVVYEAEKRRQIPVVLVVPEAPPAPEARANSPQAAVLPPPVPETPANLPQAAVVPPPAPEARTNSPESVPIAPRSVDPGAGQRTWGLALGGVGVAGLLLGGTFAIVAASIYGSIPQSCRDGGPCSTGNASTSGTAHSEATVSTIGVVAGAAFAAGGAVLYFTAPRGTTVSVSPSVGAGGAGLALGATW